ncbi:hypothetical protein D9615_008955 [Tricholomella constricta]|uniref:Uncharacterized protein n=1 Tax=Tricholomella constricta TaxID=117010 RepID=A0A8H5H1D4_9AGAR|nr:hypothetical protein D9615_008955 [Tricholomella constricta]
MTMDPYFDEKNLTIAFEEDVYTLVENHGIYRARSIFKSREAPAGAHSEPLVSDEPDYLVSETEISNSYLSATLSTIQPLDDRRSLLTLIIACHPAPGRRFVNATITWRISSPPTPPAHGPAKPTGHTPAPKIVALAPQHSVGGWTEEQTKLIWGLSVPLEVGFAGASVGITPSREKETQKAVMHAMTIIGTVRSGGARATWTVEENKSSQRGIPSHFQLAVVVDHSGPFVSDMDVKAELGGGLWPTFLQAKKGRGGNGLQRVINVDTWKCGEVVWEPGELGWKKYVAGMTGEVSGIMLEFGQAVVRP